MGSDPPIKNSARTGSSQMNFFMFMILPNGVIIQKLVCVCACDYEPPINISRFF
jgi:hypothetical protein